MSNAWKAPLPHGF